MGDSHHRWLPSLGSAMSSHASIFQPTPSGRPSSSGRCCPQGHRSVTTYDCIELPGTNGPHCDNISRFDSDVTLSHVVLKETLSQAQAGAGVPCSSTPFTARALRSYLNTWLTRTHRANLAWPRVPSSRVPPSWRGCFGCGLQHGSVCCSGRGTCVHGLCACHTGAAGIDCAEDAPKPVADSVHEQPSAPKLPASPPRVQRSGVAIYVYDLPADLGLAALAFNAYRNAGGETIYLAEW